MWKRIRYRILMWRLARYIRKLQAEQRYRSQLTVETSYDQWEDSHSRVFTVKTEKGAYARCQFARTLIDDYPSMEWLRRHAENMFKALREYHAELRRKNAWVDEDLLRSELSGSGNASDAFANG